MTRWIMGMFLCYAFWTLSVQGGELETALSSEPLPTAVIVRQYTQHGAVMERQHAYAVLREVAAKRRDKERDFLLQCLAEGLSDKEGNVRDSVAESLLNLVANGTTAVTKADMTARLKDVPLTRPCVLLAGVIDADGFRPKLRDVAKSSTNTVRVGRWYATVAWAAELALARLGEGDPDKVVRYIEVEPDLIVRSTEGLRDAAYMGNRAGILLLVKYLESDERLPAVKDNVPGEKVARRAAQLLRGPWGRI